MTAHVCGPNPAFAAGSVLSPEILVYRCPRMRNSSNKRRAVLQQPVETCCSFTFSGQCPSNVEKNARDVLAQDTVSVNGMYCASLNHGKVYIIGSIFQVALSLLVPYEWALSAAPELPALFCAMQH